MVSGWSAWLRLKPPPNSILRRRSPLHNFLMRASAFEEQSWITCARLIGRQERYDAKGERPWTQCRTLISRLGRAPSEDEVAAELKTTLHAYQQLRTDLDSLKAGTLYRMSDDASGNEEEACASSRSEDNPLVCSIQAETRQWLAGNDPRTSPRRKGRS